MSSRIIDLFWKTPLRYFSRREFFEPGGYRDLWRVAWPLVILNASTTMMMVLNRMFLSWRSSEEIAAAMPASQMFFTLMAFFLITTNFSSTIVAQYHGADDRSGCVRSMWNGFYFGAMVAALLAYLLPVAGSWVLLHNGHDPAISRLEVDYFIGMAPCAGLACMECALLSFFMGRGETRVVASIKLFSCAICVPLNYVLVFGKFGLPELGILGAGFANSLASLASLIVSLICVLLVDQKAYQTRSDTRFEWFRIKRLLTFGMPAGLQTFVRNAAFAIVVMMIGVLGREELAATSIALSINMLGNLPMIGMLDASSIVTGQFVGKRKLVAAGRIGGRAFRMMLVWWCGASILYLFFPHFLIGLFCGTTESTTMDLTNVVKYGVMILHMAIYFNIMDSLRFIMMGCLRGAGDTKVPLAIGVATAWLIQIPGTLLMVFVFKGTIVQVWLVLAFYITVDAALMLWRQRSGAWKNIHVIDEPNASPERPENKEIADVA